jgi:hypothetical protein
MRHMMLAIACVTASFGSAQAQVSPAPPAPAPSATPRQDQRADSGVPKDGVIRPDTGSTPDIAVKPPNVDPNITVPAPGTPGGDTKVVPK